MGFLMAEQAKNSLLYLILQRSNSLKREDYIDILHKTGAFPDIRTKALELHASWKHPFKVRPVHPEKLNLAELKENVKAVEFILTENLQEKNETYFCTDALQKIYCRKDSFDKKSQLYHEHYARLKVSDLLEITDYVIKCAEWFCSLDTTNMKNGVLVLKTVNFALNNQSHKRPMLESTHLAVDILSALLQNFESAPEAKKQISGGATMVKLAISFFTGK